MLGRWMVRLTACLVVATVSSCGTWLRMASLSQPPSPLLADMSGDWAAVSAEFDRRVKASFPIGVSDVQMGATLQEQGFSRRDWASSAEQEHVALRRKDTFGCKVAVHVRWRADANGRLTSVGGDYVEEVCF